MKKVRLLVNFGYYRKQWIAPFEQLPGQFEVIYLFYISEKEESQVYTSNRRVYWNEFTSAFDLLNKVNPDKVIFMSLTSGLTIGLNLACKTRSISTFVMEHGMNHNYTIYRSKEILSRQHSNSEDDLSGNEIIREGFSTKRYLKRTFRVQYFISYLLMTIYLFWSKVKGEIYATKRMRFSARKPDYYISYSPQNARIRFELDGDISDQIRYVGNLEYFELYHEITKHLKEKHENNYYLLIDQPLADNRYGERFKTKEEMIKFYVQLAIWCQGRGSKLVVKLHPESFKSTWLPQDDRITWIKESDNLGMLIAFARGCFGYCSSLLVPAIYFKPTCLFSIGESPLYDDARNFDVAQVLGFDEVELIKMKPITEKGLKEFGEEYFYKLDSDPVRNLVQVLENH